MDKPIFNPMKKLLLLLLSSLFLNASCNQPVKTTPTVVLSPTVEQIKNDTIFLSKNLIRSKYWIEYGFGKYIPKKPHIMKFINDTVVKYYFGDERCWEENYISWERYYDCYKIYNDTVEFIEKLVPTAKNDNKYEILNWTSWGRKYYRYKFYEILDYNSQKDTILEMKGESEYHLYHTLTKAKGRYNYKFPLLLNK